jgi:outer membrane protein TolC
MLRTLTCAALAALPLLVSAGEPLTLDAALAEAERGSPDLAAARARLDQARAGVALARSRYLPQLNAGASYTRNSAEVKLQVPYEYTVRDMGVPTSPAGGALPGAPSSLVAVPTGAFAATMLPRDQLAAQLELTQAIFAPAAWYGVEAAGAAARASAETAEVIRRELRLGVAQAYYGAATAQRIVAIEERQLALAQAHQRDAALQVEAGMQPRIVLLRASIEATRVTQDLERAQNGLAVAKSALAALLGRRDDGDLALAAPPPPALPVDLSRLEEDALARRPELRAARAGVEAATAERRVYTSQYLPSLAAFGKATWTDPAGLTGRNETWAAGLALSWTLFDGGGREAQRREASARLAEASASLDGAAIRAREEVRRARLELASARANRTKAEEQVALARENQRLVDAAFRAGQSTSLEATDANAAVATAELAAASEALQADLAALRLLRAAGEATEAPEAPPERNRKEAPPERNREQSR